MLAPKRPKSHNGSKLPQECRILGTSKGPSSTRVCPPSARRQSLKLPSAPTLPTMIDLDFTIIEHLSKITRVDMMIHLNQMDMQRNLISLVEDETENRLDRFAPGWRDVINRSAPRATIEAQVYEYWRTKVRALGDAETSTDQKLITGSQNQPLYWLVLVAAHKLAHKFWSESLSDGQAALFG